MSLRAYLFRLVLYPLLALSIAFIALFSIPGLAPLVISPHPLIITLLVITGFIALLAIFRAIFLTEKIRSPIQQLQDSALALAAGDYKEPLQVEGPQEIVDLGNAINTMSECLQETLSRLRESAVLRERMYGEYECSLLLQQYMLENVLDAYPNPRFLLRALSYTTASTLHGVLLDLKDNADGDMVLSFCEAIEGGFKGMYDLLSHPSQREKRNLKLTLHSDGKLGITRHEMPIPIVWSTLEGKEISLDRPVHIQSQDLIIIYNSGLSECFEDHLQLAAWFHKVLRHFATEGFDLCLTMLQHELSFLTRKQQINHDIHLLCIQLK